MSHGRRKLRPRPLAAGSDKRFADDAWQQQPACTASLSSYLTMRVR